MNPIKRYKNERMSAHTKDQHKGLIELIRF